MMVDQPLTEQVGQDEEVEEDGPNVPISTPNPPPKGEGDNGPDVPTPPLDPQLKGEADNFQVRDEISNESKDYLLTPMKDSDFGDEDVKDDW